MTSFCGTVRRGTRARQQKKVRLAVKPSGESDSSAVMCGGVAGRTERNQVLLGVIAGLAAKFLVMNLKM
jgi:hypothetical protein